MPEKPKNPYPPLVRRALRKVLPHSIYRRYVGRHEDESMRLWRGIAASIPADKAILDIGAFHGEYALAARQVNGEVSVHAFEPNPHSVPVLRAACEREGIVVEEIAVAEENGTLPFVCCSAGSHLTDVVVSSTPQDQVCDVTAVTLDTWTSENAIAPSLIKIDTEGAEAGILRSAQRVLHDYHPIILCEVLTDLAGEEVAAALPSCYRFLFIEEHGGTEERSLITRQYWRNHNWLLIPEDRYVEVRT